MNCNSSHVTLHSKNGRMVLFQLQIYGIVVESLSSDNGDSAIVPF